MEYTHLDYFNYYLKEFCNELIANFPDFEKSIVANYRELLENKNSKNDLYVKYFISKVNDHMEDICNSNTELFVASRWFNEETKVQSGLFFLEGVDFVALWNSSHNNEATQQAIWKYLKLLVLLGRKVVPNRDEVLDILNGVGGQVYAPAKVEKTLKGDDDDLDDAGNKPDLLGLGNIAGLAGLMGIGSGEVPDLSGIVKTLGDALGNIDMSEITKQMEAAQQEAVNSMDGDASGEDVSGEKGEESNETTEGEEEQTPTAGMSSSTTNLFTDLAKEMTETFDFSSLEGNEPANMGEAFSKFLSGDNPAKLMGLVGKFGSKLQKDVASGKINQGDLLKDTQKMMAGLQGGDASALKKQAQQMAKENPALAQQMQQMQKQNQSHGGGDTRARLQAKLAAKRATTSSEGEGNTTT
jgi:hypothetical protein